MPIPGGYSGYYLTPADIRLTLAGIDNNPGTAATLEDADLQDAIDEAQSEVDGKLAAHGYQVPFAATAIPRLVVNVTRDIACYLATLTYRRGEPLAATDPIALRYARAQANLKGMADGSIEIPVAGGTVEAAATPGAVANPWTGDLWAPEDFRLTTSPPGFPVWPRGW